MTPLLTGIFASQISGHLYSPVGSYDSIATVTVPSGGLSSITFAGIPTGYRHLQVRMFVQQARATYGTGGLAITFNSDATANYNVHWLYGDGASTNANYDNTQNYIGDPGLYGTTAGGDFGAGVLDILDYANTTKNKVTRHLAGVDLNGTLAGFGGRVGLVSGLWRNTAAINSIQIANTFGNFSQYSSFALYGIR